MAAVTTAPPNSTLPLPLVCTGMTIWVMVTRESVGSCAACNTG